MPLTSQDAATMPTSEMELKVETEDGEFSYKQKSVQKKQTELQRIMIIMIGVYLLCGAVLIVIGSWIVIEKTEARSITALTVYWPAVLSIIAGVFLIVLSFSDAVVLYSSHGRDLRTFFVALTVIVSLQMAALITCAVKHYQLDDNLTADMSESMLTKYGQDGRVTQYWDHMQQVHKCCGVLNHTDWQAFGMGIPLSCQCDGWDPFVECMNAVNSTLLYVDGCLPKLANFLRYYFEVIELVNGLMIVFVIIAAFASLCSGCRIFRQSTVASYVFI